MWVPANFVDAPDPPKFSLPLQVSFPALRTVLPYAVISSFGLTGCPGWQLGFGFEGPHRGTFRLVR